jgi:hypothetical protein
MVSRTEPGVIFFLALRYQITNCITLPNTTKKSSKKLKKPPKNAQKNHQNAHQALKMHQKRSNNRQKMRNFQPQDQKSH